MRRKVHAWSFAAKLSASWRKRFGATVSLEVPQVRERGRVPGCNIPLFYRLAQKNRRYMRDKIERIHDPFHLHTQPQTVRIVRRNRGSRNTGR